MINVLKSCANSDWTEMESALFIIAAFIHNIAEGENEAVPHLLDSLFTLQSTVNTMLLNTSAEILGNLQDWLQADITYLSKLPMESKR